MLSNRVKLGDPYPDGKPPEYLLMEELDYNPALCEDDSDQSYYSNFRIPTPAANSDESNQSFNHDPLTSLSKAPEEPPVIIKRGRGRPPRSSINISGTTDNRKTTTVGYPPPPRKKVKTAS